MSGQVAQTTDAGRGVVAGHAAIGLRGVHVVGIRHVAEINFNLVLRGMLRRNRRKRRMTNAGGDVVDVSSPVFAGEEGGVVCVCEGQGEGAVGPHAVCHCQPRVGKSMHPRSDGTRNNHSSSSSSRLRGVFSKIRGILRLGLYVIRIGRPGVGCRDSKCS